MQSHVINETERLQKQNYLKKEIIDGNYEPADFEAFVSNLKEDGSNIDNWSFDELIQIVESFKKSQPDFHFDLDNQVEQVVEQVPVIQKPPLKIASQKELDSIFEEFQLESLKSTIPLANQKKQNTNLNKFDDFGDFSSSPVENQQQLKKEQNKREQQQQNKTNANNNNKANSSNPFDFPAWEIKPQEKQLGFEAFDQFFQVNKSNNLEEKKIDQPSYNFPSAIIKNQPSLSNQQSQQIQKQKEQQVKSQIAQSVIVAPKLIEQQKPKPNFTKDTSQSDEQVQQSKAEEFSNADIYDQEISVTKIIPQVQIEENIFITISKPIQKSGGILSFGRTYLEYEVISLPYGWQVQRKFSDFKWLHNTLMRIFPGYFVPNLVKKKGQNDKAQIIQRMYFMETFLNNLARSRTLFYHPLAIEFLSQTNIKKFKAVQKEADKLKQPQKPSDMTNLEGTVKCKLTKENQQFLDVTNQFFSSAAPIYKRINKQMKQLVQQCEQISNTLFGIGDNFSLLHQLSHEMNTKIGSQNSSALQDFEHLYKNSNNLLIQYGNLFGNDVKFAYQDMYNYIKYTSYEFNSYKELYQRCVTAQQDYQKFKQRLSNKKEKLFELADPNKWEITKIQQLPSTIKTNKQQAFPLMCTKETEKENELKEFYAYILTQLREQINKQFSLSFSDFKENYKQYSSAHSNFAKNLLNLFGEYEELFKVKNLMIQKSKNSEILSRNVIEDYDKKSITSKKN